MRRLILLLLLSSPLAWGGESGDSLEWQNRSLRKVSADGYLAVVVLDHERTAKPQATLICPAEKVALIADGRNWQIKSGDDVVAKGEADVDVPERFLVKRTPDAVLVGLNGRWVYGQKAEAPTTKASVRVGLAEGMGIRSIRIVPREPARFADDFPDPVPQAGVWTPVRGSWALSSLSFPEQSANPAELAAIFDPLEDEGSRGRNREVYFGIGVRLQGSSYASVLRMAGDSPAERAGIRQSDRIKAIDDVAVRGADAATAMLAGPEGSPVKVTFTHQGTDKTVTMKRKRIVWGKTRRQVPILPSTSDANALITTGYDFWTDYKYATTTRTYDVGALGMVFAYLGPDDYHVFRWLGARLMSGGYGKWLLERVRQGKRTVLASREAGFQANDFYGLAIRVGGDRLGEIGA
ncbi:PDZ domain-containing protein, partial [bacterium]|nr:PDZ domain-containing protein [bacterium]